MSPAGCGAGAGAGGSHGSNWVRGRDPRRGDGLRLHGRGRGLLVRRRCGRAQAPLPECRCRRAPRCWACATGRPGSRLRSGQPRPARRILPQIGALVGGNLVERVALCRRACGGRTRKGGWAGARQAHRRSRDRHRLRIAGTERADSRSSRSASRSARSSARSARSSRRRSRQALN